MAEKYIYKLGRRKTAVATMRLFEGSGQSTINGKPVETVYNLQVDQINLIKPFTVLGLNPKDFHFSVRLIGGGKSAGVGAISLALSRALATFEESNKKTLRQHDLLTRDPRMVERKKTGRRKARKSEQYSKR